MNATITSAMLASAMSVQERALYGLQVFVVGMVAVFAVLTILWGVMVLFRLFAYDLPNKKKEKAQAAAAAVEHPVPAAEDIPLAAPAAAGDSELVAVIAAAISAYNAAAGNNLGFRVVSYKRVHSAGGWNGAANNESN